MNTALYAYLAVCIVGLIGVLFATRNPGAILGYLFSIAVWYAIVHYAFHLFQWAEMDYTIYAQFESEKSISWASTDYYQVALMIKNSFEQFVYKNHPEFGKIIGFIISQKPQEKLT